MFRLVKIIALTVFLANVLIVCCHSNINGLYAQNTAGAFQTESPIQKQESVFITGMLKDALTGKVLEQKDARITLYGSDKAVQHAQVCESGHYGIAINKTGLSFPNQLVVKIKGYKNVIINLNHEDSYVHQDILLKEDVIEAADLKKESETTFKMNDSPFSPFILKVLTKK